MIQNYQTEGSYEIEHFDESTPDFYDEETLLTYIEDDMLSNEEEGFMIGYLAA